MSSARSHLSVVRPPDPETVDAIDRRTHPRLTLSDLGWLTAVRLKYGPVVSLIDLSAGGAQIETGTQLQPGNVVVVQISGSGGEVTLPSNVLRSHVAHVGPSAMSYRTALSFKRLFQPPQQVEQNADLVTSLVAEQGRMTAALRRLSSACTARTEIPATSEAILTSTLALIQTAPDQRADSPFRRHLTALFREVTQGIESGTEPDIMLDRLVERLRRSVPARMIRFTFGCTPVGSHGPDTVYFDALNEGAVVARLIVEFPTSCRLEKWHLQFLRISAQLVALVSEVAALRMAAVPDVVAEPQPAPVATAVIPVTPLAVPPQPIPVSPLPASEAPAPANAMWLPVVARYADGRVLKGYCRGFAPSGGYLSISATADPAPASISTVKLRHLKAVFFVQDLDGAPSAADPTPTAPGRNVVVTFMDGEVVRGTTLNYTHEGSGFFLSPHEERRNNVRMFVVHDAVRHVQFP